MSCDNLREAHDPRIIGEDQNAIRWHCIICQEGGVVRKDERGSPEKREYIRVFRRYSLQGNDNLFYRYYPQFINR